MVCEMIGVVLERVAAKVVSGMVDWADLSVSPDRAIVSDDCPAPHIAVAPNIGVFANLGLGVNGDCTVQPYWRKKSGLAGDVSEF
ncbi:hypothetical protein D3C76_1489520 [compost metagenome]